MNLENNWALDGSTKDQQSMTRDWQSYNNELIEGVIVKEVKNVIVHNGFLTEIFRTDWGLENVKIEQIFQRNLNPSAISGWHVHQFTTDRIFVNNGSIKIVLYDARENSSTYEKINEFIFGDLKPGLVVIPSGVYHGIKNVSSEKSSILNIVDFAYQYENPDHWRLPLDSPHIPYKF